jgi:hypothetical protein
MTELQKKFEATGYTSWINADLYPDGKIYTKEYTQWLERQVLALRQPPVIGSVCDGCGSKFDAMDIKVGVCYCCQKEIKQTDL